MPTVAEVKKLESGKLAVRWKGEQKFLVINDDLIAAYLIFIMTREPSEKYADGKRLRAI